MSGTVLVFGGTGAQGGAVINSLLQEKGFKVRAVTRNVDSQSSKNLIKKGVEVVKGDFDDIPSIQKALKGVDSVFLVTQFWEKMDGLLEEKQGKAVVDEIKKAGVKHLVFSSLEDVEATKKYKVAHFDSKGRISAYIKKLGIPLTEVLVSFYMQNFLTMLSPKVKNDKIVFSFPLLDGVTLDLIDINDLGNVVRTILKNPKDHIGKAYGLAGDSLDGKKIAQVVAKATGREVDFEGADPEKVAEFIGVEMANMFRFYKDEQGKLRSVKDTKKLNSDTRSWEKFVASNLDYFKNLK